jgi:integrase/recombinase XerD
VKIAQCVENFVARKRACGYDYYWSALILRRFSTFVGKIDIGLVSEEHINLFLARGDLAHHIWRSYRSLIRRFLAYWFARRQIGRIPEAEQKPNIGTRFFPYVYSKSEIARLLAATSMCQVRRRCTIGSSTLSTILLFLYGTGLRVTEALSLSDSNIDFRKGSIDICPGSLYRHRTIPMGRDVQCVLLRHLRSPERASFGTGKALFLTRNGHPVTYGLLRSTFGRLRRTAGIFRPNCPLPPRLQDLRHTFAVHSIARWSQDGLSYEKMLPMLTAYMGNVRETGLLRYFELTPSRYRAQLACLDVRTRAPDVAIRPANSDQECRKELQNSNGRNSALRVGADLPSEFL